MQTIVFSFKKRDWITSTLSAFNRDDFATGTRALFALSIVFWVHWLANWQNELLPVLLGVIASALTETDDHWTARIRYHLIAMCAFLFIALAVWLSLPWPELLAFVIACSAFVLTMLGAIGERYRAIAFGALVFLLYSALSSHESSELGLNSIPLILGGAMWYGVCSILWFAALPQQPVHARLSKLYALLGEYLRLKAQLLEPIREIDQAERRMALVIQNGKVVKALNSTKESLLSRIRASKNPDWLKLALHQYLVAQDIHERTSSSHEDYSVLANTFFHSDVLYRCQRILILFGKQALTYSSAIQSRTPPIHQGATKRAIEDLNSAILNIEKNNYDKGALQALYAVRNNLVAMASTFANVFTLTEPTNNQSLHDREAANIGEAWLRIKKNLNLRSPLFRHALRLSCSLIIGFGFMRIMHDQLGYWILLTILFVSQQQYAATHSRLIQRTAGTAIGLALGWALTQLFSAVLVQSAGIVILGALFFGARHNRYTLATTAITALLVVSFHQIGLRQELFPARLWDTLIGCVIAGIAAWLVLPNWQWRLWPSLASTSLKANANYLHEIMNQYARGESENLAYRLARRDAHNADAALSNAFAAMKKEPKRVRINELYKGNFLLSSHTFLNYLSALGAHRNMRSESQMSQEILATANVVHSSLNSLADAIDHKNESESTQIIDKGLKQYSEINKRAADFQSNEQDRLIKHQLNLCIQILPRLAEQIR